MKTQPIPRFLQTACLTFLSCTLLAGAVVAAVDIVYPAPENQTAFIKTYTPADTIAPFSLEALQLTGPGGSSAGRGCAFHEKGFEALLVISPEKQFELMTAVRQDLMSKLNGEGARIVLKRASAGGAFVFDYRVGRSKGSVVIDPLIFVDPATIAGPGTTRPSEIGVRLRLQIKETWYKTRWRACGEL